MTWPPPSTVVIVAGTVRDDVTSPQSAVNVNVVAYVRGARTDGRDVSPRNGSGGRDGRHPRHRHQRRGRAVQRTHRTPEALVLCSAKPGAEPHTWNGQTTADSAES